MGKRSRLLGLTSAMGLATATVAFAPAAFADSGGHGGGLTPSSPVTVVASGLNNPRGLTWGPDGRLLVAEAGLGGSDCVTVAPGPLGQECFGLTGSISAIRHHGTTRVVTGLASVSAPNGEGITGPDGLASHDGHLFTVITAAPQLIPGGLSPALTTSLFDQLGRVLDVTPWHAPSSLADPGAYDYAWSDLHQSLAPGQFPDANPYGLAVADGGTYVVDAGSNTLDQISPDGTVQVLAFVPNPPASDAVPTCVAKGPDGAVYVGQLTGAGNAAGAANIYRYTPSSGLTVWQTGLTAVTGCGFGKDGAFYATEFDLTGFPPSAPPVGAVVRIAPDGTRTLLGQGQLFAPNGFLAGPDGSIYVSNYSVMGGTDAHGPGPVGGEVVRIG